MTNQEMLAEALDIDPAAARAVPDRIRKMAFFEQLAAHGIVTENEQDALRMLEASDRLEAKRAAVVRSHDPVTRAIDLLVPKQAAAPASPGLVHDTRQAPSLDRSVNQKVAMLLQDPLVYGALMTAFTE